MRIKDNLINVRLPKTFKREGKDCYFDTYRKRLIEITPEETVRQKVARYFEINLGVPRELMLLEVPMSYYVKGLKGRADIIIHKYEDNGMMKPIAVIECKNETIPLTDSVSQQAISYCDIIEADYIIITNGIDVEIAKYNNNDDVYEWIDDIITYSQMLEEKGDIIKKFMPYTRFTFSDLQEQDLINNYNDLNEHWVFGQDTKNELRGTIVNLYQCLMDEEHKLPCVKRKNFEVLEDIGLRYMDYSNAGGGHYLGYYRAFLIEDNSNSTQIVSMSIFGTDPGFRNEGRSSYTSLIIAIDKFNVSHNNLQYNIDKYTEVNGINIKFLHNGQISSRPAKPLVEYVGQHSENIKKYKEKLELGSIVVNKLLYLDDPEVFELIYNLIEYSLLREEYR